MVHVNQELDIPESELTFVTSRSSGPGGQNVNKVDTRVTLLFDVGASASLTDEQRRRVFERLAGRINREGILRVVSQRHRTQSANREAVVSRFAGLLRDTLMEERERIPVTVPAGANERRLAEKRHRKRIKRERSLDPSQED